MSRLRALLLPPFRDTRKRCVAFEGEPCPWIGSVTVSIGVGGLGDPVLLALCHYHAWMMLEQDR